MSTPDDPRLIAALARLGAALRPQAGGEALVVHLAPTGALDRTLRIEGGTLRIERGRPARRDLRLRGEAAVLAAVFEGERSFEDAFAAGAVQADDARALLRLAGVLDLRPTPAREAPTASRPLPLPPAVDGPAPLGRRYDGGHALVRAEDILAYAAATDDPHPAYEGPGAVAPPLFHARLVRDLLWALMQDPDLCPDMRWILHLSHEARWWRPLHVGDLVHLRAVLVQVEETRSGRLFGARMHAIVDGELAVEATTRFFVRAPGPHAARVPEREDDPDLTRLVPMAADQSVRYAAASGDDNPVHLDADLARAAGLPDRIVHGLCTMAMAGAALLRAVDADPRQLRHLALRWSRPVLNGQTLTLRAWRRPPGLCFDLLGPDGQPVAVDGRAELSP